MNNKIYADIKIKNQKKLNLSASYYESDTETVIIMCHGFLSEKTQSGRFEFIAKNLFHETFSIIRFDFSGCGSSDRDKISVEGQVADLKSVIAFCKAKGYKNIGLIGFSLGGLVALKAASEEISCIALIAPVTAAIDYCWSTRFSELQLREFMEEGFIKVKHEHDPHISMEIDKQYLIERETVDQKMLLSTVACPVLICHGDLDERVPYSDSEKAVALLKNAELYKLSGSNHGFVTHLAEVTEKITQFFIKNLGGCRDY